MTQTGLLVGKNEIRKFLGDASDYMMKKYLEMGMPVVIENKQWLAHKENIEDFFKLYTRKKVSDVDAAMLENCK